MVKLMTVPFYPANILLPKENFEKWSVIACDQYTSDSKYWKDVEEIVADAPSALKITLPEIYLEEDDVEERVEKINETMEKYLADGIFEELTNQIYGTIFNIISMHFLAMQYLSSLTRN